MSVIPLEVINVVSGVMVYRWMGLENGDTGEPLSLPHSSDKTVQVYGTFGSGGSVTLQGSNNKADESQTFATLHKVDLSSVIYTSAGMDVVIDNPIAIRPSVTAGDGDTSLNVILCCCKTIK